MDRENQLDVLIEKVSSIDKRLKIIESAFVFEEVQEESTTSSTEQTTTEQPVAKTATKKAKAQPKGSSGNTLGYIAIFCFILAASFIIKLTLDSGWLTPFRQLILSGILGGALVALGTTLFQNDKKYANLLPGAGMAIWYLTLLGGHLGYQIIPLHFTIIGMAVVSTIALYLAHQKENSLFLIVATIGTYCSPILLHLENASPFNISLYFLVWAILFSYLATFYKDRTLHLLSAYLGLGLYAILGDIKNSGLNQYQYISLFQALQFIIFASGTVLYSIKNQRVLTKNESWSYFPLILFFYATEYYYLKQIIPAYAPWISLGFAAFLQGIYFIAKNSLKDREFKSDDIVFSFSAIVLFHAGYLTLLPERFTSYVIIALALIVGALFPRIPAIRKVMEITLVKMVVIGVLLLEYGRIFLKVVDGKNLNLEGVTLGYIVTFMIVGFYVMNRRDGSKERQDSLILLMAHAQAMAATYNLLEANGTIAVSLGWGVYAFIILFFGGRMKDAFMAKSSVFLFLILAGKVLLYDVSNSAPIIRIICLILSGGMLFLGGYFLRKIASWDETAKQL